VQNSSNNFEIWQACNLYDIKCKCKKNSCIVYRSHFRRSLLALSDKIRKKNSNFKRYSLSICVVKVSKFFSMHSYSSLIKKFVHSNFEKTNLFWSFFLGALKSDNFSRFVPKICLSLLESKTLLDFYYTSIIKF